MKKFLRWIGGILLIITILFGITLWGCRMVNSIQDTRLFNYNTQSGEYYDAWRHSWFYRESVYTYGTYTALLVGVLGCTLLLVGLEDKK
jgi:hypothetical protein